MGSKQKELLLLLSVLLACIANAQETTEALRRPSNRDNGSSIGFQPTRENSTNRSRQGSRPVPRTQQGRPSDGAHAAVRPAALQEPGVEELLETDMDQATVDAPELSTASNHAEMFCCSTPSWYGDADYLLWWTAGMDVPALATTGNAADAVPGAIGQPNTRILFGNTGLNDDARSGGRFTLGKWLDPCELSGIQITYLGLGSSTESFNASDANFAILGRPFFNTQTAAQDVEYIALPAALANGPVTGTLNITATTEFQTFEAVYRRADPRSSDMRFEYLVGYRYAELNDRVRIDETTVSAAGAQAVFDEFDTRNSFHGGEFGMIFQQQYDPCWSWGGMFKLALGGTQTRAALTGGTNGAANGGLLVQGPTNLGIHELDEFGVLTEVGISLRRNMQCGLVASIGYSFLLWTTVYRAGDQIDLSVNPQQIIPPGNGTGDLRPAFPTSSSEFWAQGFQVGLEYSF